MINEAGGTGRRTTAAVRRNTQALTRDLQFCLVPLPGGQFKFTDVAVVGGPHSRAAVEFLVYLMEDRTVAEVLRALPAAAAACHFAPAMARELLVFFEGLVRLLKHNATAFVIEPAPRPDIRATVSGLLPAAASATALPELPELPELPVGVNDSARVETHELPTVRWCAEPDTVVCEVDSTTVLSIAEYAGR